MNGNIWLLRYLYFDDDTNAHVHDPRMDDDAHRLNDNMMIMMMWLIL